jgi:hypothetical protein
MQRWLGAAVSALVGLTLVAPSAGAASSSGIPHVTKPAPGILKVHPGGSIQAAVDAADPGETVVVAAGVYHESVTIRTDGITLRGAGPRLSILVPPADMSGTCTKFSGGSGVCVLGRFGAGGSIADRTARVSILGLGFRGWPGMGVFALGAKKLTISGNEARSIGEYGFARFDSVGGSIVDNVAKATGEAGIYVGDSANADVAVRNNRVAKSLFGIFVRHAHRVVMEHNMAWNNCQGIFVLDDGQPGGAGHSLIRYNVVNENNRACPGGDEAPPLRGGGIALLGAVETTVSWNVVRSNRGNKLLSGGVVLMSSKQITGGSHANDNTVVRNIAYGNEPLDIRWDGKGSGNVVTGNSCGTASDPGFC